MFVWSVLAPIAASTTAIAALEEGETGAATGHATACTTNDAPDDGEGDEPSYNNANNDRPPERGISKQWHTITLNGEGTDLQYTFSIQLSQLEKVVLTPFT